MKTTPWEKLAFGVVLLLAATSLGYFAWAPVMPVPPRSKSLTPAVGADLTKSDQTPTTVNYWRAPDPGSRDSGWMRDIFTAPEVRMNRADGELTFIRPADDTVMLDNGSAAFGVEVDTIQRRPFRLQLLGYVGTGEECAGWFANLESGETVLARAGRVFPDLGLVVASVRITRTPAESTTVGATVVPVARAEVRDMSTGAVTFLTDAATVYVPGEWAFLRLASERKPFGRFVAGEEFRVGSQRYRVERISLLPSAVDVARLEPDGSRAEVRTLEPTPAPAGGASASPITRP